MLLIFDYDGVLRSISWEGLQKAYLAIAADAGCQNFDFLNDPIKFKTWFNPDWKVNLVNLGITDQGYYPRNIIIFHQVYDPYARIFPWVESIIEELFDRYLLAILSASSKLSIKKNLNITAGYFDFIVGCEEVSKLKPNPEGIFTIKKEFPEVPTESIWIIGDSTVDILAGKAASIKTCAVSWGMDDYQKLAATKPNLLIDKPEDLLTL
jgi:phosphoglycolate phosphatase-like HAD superfamily hydrolase